MNKNLKYQALGALVGGGIGYIVGSIICDVCCPEYEEVEPKGEERVIDTDRFDRAAERIRVRKDNTKGDAQQGVVNYNQIRTKPDLSALAGLTAKYKAPDLEGPVTDEDLTDERELPDVETTDPDAPFVISSDQYDSMEDYRSATIHYYVLDETSTDENDGLVDNVEDIIGEDGLSSFGEDSGDADVVYIRNPKFKCDYEVIRLHKSYTADVLGLKPATKVRKVNMFDEEDN